MKTSLKIVLLVVALVAASCVVQWVPSSGAAIRVSLGGQSTSSVRSLLHVSQWQLTGTGPDGETFDTGALDFSQTVTKSDLMPGEWTFEAQGLNADGKSVSSAKSTITLEVGQTTDVPLTLSFAPLTSDTEWKFVDGGTAKGLTDAAVTDVISPAAAVIKDVVYVASADYVPTPAAHYAVKVRAYNGDDDAPAWTNIDPDATSGLNRGTDSATVVSLLSFKDELYALWPEGTSPRVVHASRYNPPNKSWTDLDSSGGLGYITSGGTDGYTSSSFGVNLTNSGDNLYAVWVQNANGRNWLHASQYVSGTTWTPLYSSSNELPEPSILGFSAVGFDGQLVVSWIDNATGDLRVSTYDGSSWNTMSTPVATGTSPRFPQLAVSNSHLVLTWYEIHGNYVVRVSQFNGDFASPSWSFLEPSSTVGLNHDSSRPAYGPTMVDVNGGLVLLSVEDNGTTLQARARVFGGDFSSPSWSFIDGDGSNGLNHDPAYASVYLAAANANGKLYVVSAEDSGYSANSLHVIRGQ